MLHFLVKKNLKKLTFRIKTNNKQTLEYFQINFPFKNRKLDAKDILQIKTTLIKIKVITAEQLT